MSSWLCLLGNRGSRWLFLSDQFPLRRDWLPGFRESWHGRGDMGEGLSTDALAGTCLLGPGQRSHRLASQTPPNPTWNFHLPRFPLLRAQLLISSSGLDSILASTKEAYLLLPEKRKQRLRKLGCVSEWKKKAKREICGPLLSSGTRLRLCSLLGVVDGASLPYSAPELVLKGFSSRGQNLHVNPALLTSSRENTGL